MKNHFNYQESAFIITVFRISVIVFLLSMFFLMTERSFAATSTTAPVCDPSVNLVSNGSFESPDLTSVVPVTGWDIFESKINGLDWEVSWINPVGAPVVALLELQNGYNAPDGLQYAELDSNWSKAPGLTYAGEATPVSIEQSIHTIKDAEYALNWSFSPLPGYDTTDNVLEILVDGVVLKTNSADGIPLNDIDWVNDSVSFIGTGAVMTVTFRDAGKVNSFGTLLDNVSLNCIDAPVVTKKKSSSSSSGTRTNRNNKIPTLTPTPTVAGLSTSSVPSPIVSAPTPTPLVVAEQVSVVPVGAPDTGAGGTAKSNYPSMFNLLLTPRRLKFS